MPQGPHRNSYDLVPMHVALLVHFGTWESVQVVRLIFEDLAAVESQPNVGKDMHASQGEKPSG